MFSRNKTYFGPAQPELRLKLYWQNHANSSLEHQSEINLKIEQNFGLDSTLFINRNHNGK